MPFPLPIPTIPQVIFLAVAGFTALCALLVVVSRNLFHSALLLVGTLFGVAGVYVLLEAEFLAVSQVLIYVGAISTLITFAIMLTRGMMQGQISTLNRNAGSAALAVILFFLVIGGIVQAMPWPEVYEALETIAWPVGYDGIAAGRFEEIISLLGEQFVTTYLVTLEVLGVLLLVALVGAVMLARDR